MKKCTVCFFEKPLSEFEHARRQCRACRKEYGRVRRAAYYAKDPEAAIEKVRVWRAKNEDHRRARRQTEYARNRDAARAAAVKYRRDNKAKVRAWSRAHQTAKQERFPGWLEPDDLWMMEQAYELAALRTKLFGFPWHVDHIIPLRGKSVSGLHVPTNLQVIPGADNQRKRNTVTAS